MDLQLAWDPQFLKKKLQASTRGNNSGKKTNKAQPHFLRRRTKTAREPSRDRPRPLFLICTFPHQSSGL
jgi:hypothetical protein